MGHTSRVYFYAVTYVSMLTLLQGAKFDECGPKPAANVMHAERRCATPAAAGSAGVVTTTKAASIGASLLAKCGRKLFLKYSIDTEALSKGFSQTCLMLQLCNAYHEGLRTKKKKFIDAMAHCFVRGFEFIAASCPELLNMFSGSVEEIMNSTARCIKGDFLGSDVKISLAMVRYVRSVIFMNGKG